MDYLLRSLMYVPAINRRYLDKALSSDADALILDIEDSVSKEHKKEARENIVEYFAQGKFRGRQVLIRLNYHESDSFQIDLETLAFDDQLGYVLPKIRDAADVMKIDRAVSDMETRHGFPRGKFVFAPLLENASAIANAKEIAHASPRLIALLFGGEDYLENMGCVSNHYAPALDYPRNVVAVAARSADLIPIDTPYLAIEDLEGFRKEELAMYRRGFGGCQLLSPRQINVANEVFAPTLEEIEHAEGIARAIEEARELGMMTARYEDSAIGPPMQKLAKRILAKRDLIARANAKKASLD